MGMEDRVVQAGTKWAMDSRRAGWYGRLMVAILIGCTAVAGACGRKATYSQATPDDVIRSAVEMVKNKDTKQLGSLIYADSPEMRYFLDKLGELFGHMQTLAVEVEGKFPQEMAEMKAKAAEAAAAGKADPLLSALAGMGGSSMGGRRGGPGDSPVDENAARDLVNRLFADPYGWLERNADRLSALKTSDDTASVMFDDKPIIPVVGLPMRLENERWYIALPTNFPGVSRAMPRSKEQWSILVSVVKVLDRTVVELTEDVRMGKVPTLDSLAKQAREKAMLPAVIAFAAYGKEMEVRNRVDRRVKQFQTKQKAWVKAKAGEDEDPESPAVSQKLSSVLGKLANQRIEPMVRKNKAPAFDRMSDRDFETLVAAWLAEAGIQVKIDGDLTPAKVDSEIERWEVASGTAAKVVKKR
jgi:hypothetical protein